MQEKIKILVAEDNELQLNMFCNALSKAGFEVIPASSGIKIYHDVLKNQPHLILLDIKMPEIDGIEICRNLKRAPNTKDIIIVIHSSKKDTELMDLASEFGADGYIIKSDNLEQMVERTKEIIRDKLGKDV